MLSNVARDRIYLVLILILDAVLYSATVIHPYPFQSIVRSVLIVLACFTVIRFVVSFYRPKP